jgi:hypothetical protein
MCWSKLVSIEKTLAYYKICPFAVNYEFVMFYSTGPPNVQVLNGYSLSKLKLDCNGKILSFCYFKEQPL